MVSPYEALDRRAFWRTGVSETHFLRPADLYRKKFAIEPDDRIATAGSCFAQHIARQLRASGYKVLDVEPPPPGLTGAAAEAFGYNLYSARHGNIYTVRQLRQLAQESLGSFKPSQFVWEKQGRFYDALRPAVEPQGLASHEAVEEHRKQHLRLFSLLLHNTTVFIFTLGLTETWRHKADGTVYPTAPGTIAGNYDPSCYEFVNLTYNDVVQDFLSFRSAMQKIQPGIRFILTVSPVPLTATAGPEHVLPATMYSKSVLRAAAGFLALTFPDVDYFPSYEIIAGHPSKGALYESNLRSVAPAGVDIVMETFFSQHKKLNATGPISAGDQTTQALPRPVQAVSSGNESVWCEEELLDAFAK